MDKRKCRHCEHVRYLKRKGELWVLETPDGKLAVPVIDLATIESLSRQKDARPMAKGAHAPGRRNYISDGETK
jgi:hypothetical protein